MDPSVQPVRFPTIDFSFIHQISLPISQFLFYLLLLALLSYIVSKIFGKFSWLLVKREPLVFLELIFPSDTNKSPFSTEKLLALLHSLAKNRGFLRTLLRDKKGYSLEIVASKKKGIRYLLVVPEPGVSLVEKDLFSYLPGLKIKKTEDYLLGDLKKDKKATMVELKLKNDFVLPLKRNDKPAEHDPISYLMGNMTKLDKKELMAFQLVVTPLSDSKNPKERRHLSRMRRQIYHNRPLGKDLFLAPWQKAFNCFPLIFLKWILAAFEFALKSLVSITLAFWDTRGETVPFFSEKSGSGNKKKLQNPYESQLRVEIKSKIDQPLFEASARLLAYSDRAPSRQLRMTGLLSSFDSLKSTHQELVPQRKNPTTKPSAALHLRKVSLFGNPILSVTELSDMYHFPYTKTTKTEDLIKTHTQELPAPLSLKNNPNLDVVFGENNYGNTACNIGLTDDDRSRHMYLIGQTGSGKSTIIHHMAADDIKKGRGLAVIDPHGDLAEGLLDTILAKRTKDVIYFNPFDVEYPIGINLLELSPGLTGNELELEKELVCESVISVFRRAFQKDDLANAHRIEYILRNAIYTAFAIPERTIFTVFDLLTDPKFRRGVLKDLRDEKLVNFWRNEFGKAGDYQVVKMAGGVTSRVGRFLFSPIAKRILEQKKSTIDFDKIIDDEKILLCNLAEGRLGEDTAQLLGTTVIAKIHLSMIRRAQIETRDRKPFYLFVDEFQNFATGSFTKLLSSGRKYGLRITIAEQSTAQQENRNIVDVILANVGTIVSFRTASPLDEKLMMPLFAPLVDVGNIANLPRHHFYIKLAALEPEDSFSGVTFPINTPKNKERKRRIIEASRKNYATKYEETKLAAFAKSVPEVASATPKKSDEEVF